MKKPKYDFALKVQGMHCAACELVIEKSFRKISGVKEVDARLKNEKVYFNLSKKIDPEIIRAKANELLTDSEYYILAENEQFTHQVNWLELVKAGLIAAIIIGIFLLLERLGIVNVLNSSEINLPFIFVIGVVASLSSCMAVVGGLLLSFSSTLAQHSHIEKIKPMAIFHLARIVSFFFLGGLVGILGSAFALSNTLTFFLNLALFLVMLILGINLLNVFPIFRKLQLRMPKVFAKKAMAVENRGTSLAALALGVLTFFLPCGFTQATQFLALSTGNFIQGALTMLVFALGTFPVLALISFASLKFAKGLQSGLFFKVAGMLMIFFAFINLRGALISLGIF